MDATPVPEPRTVSGRAAISAMRPYVKRALGRTIAAIEDGAAAPYLEALREADEVLASLIADAAADADFVVRAQAARKAIQPLLDE